MAFAYIEHQIFDFERHFRGSSAVFTFYHAALRILSTNNLRKKFTDNTQFYLDRFIFLSQFSYSFESSEVNQTPRYLTSLDSLTGHPHTAITRSTLLTRASDKAEPKQQKIIWTGYSASLARHSLIKCRLLRSIAVIFGRSKT